VSNIDGGMIMAYVYGLYKKNFVYITNKIDEGLFYIGITNDTKLRFNSHKVKKSNPIKKSYIEKYDFEIKILYTYKTREEALEKESFLIKWFGKICDGTGILTNILTESSDIGYYNLNKNFAEPHKTNMSKNALNRNEEYWEKQRDDRLSFPIEEIKEILQEWKNSFPIDKKEILKKYNIKANTFNWWIRKYRPDLRNLIKENQTKHCNIIKHLNCSQTKYAKEIGVCTSTISKWYCDFIRDKKQIKSKIMVKDLNYKKQKYKEWMESNLSKRSFCKKNNINYGSFKAWKKYYEEY